MRNEVEKLKAICAVLKKHFGNLTVAQTLDIAGEIMEKLDGIAKREAERSRTDV